MITMSHVSYEASSEYNITILTKILSNTGVLQNVKICNCVGKFVSC